MSRTVVDGDLRRWEVFASTGPSGYAAPARIVFRCRSDRTQVSRAVAFDGDHSAGEAWVEAAADGDLLGLFVEARPLS